VRLPDRLARLDVSAAHEMGRRARKRVRGVQSHGMAEQLLALYRSLAPALKAGACRFGAGIGRRISYNSTFFRRSHGIVRRH